MNWVAHFSNKSPWHLIAFLLLTGCAACSRQGAAVGHAASNASSGISISGTPVAPPVWPVEPTPGQTVPFGGKPAFYYVHRGGDFCAYSVVFNSVIYSIDVSCQNEDIVLYVSTLDNNFYSPEGLSTASSMRAAIDVGGELLLGKECEVLLPSGWTAHPNIRLAQYAKTAEECSVALGVSIKYFDRHTIEEGRE